MTPVAWLLLVTAAIGCGGRTSSDPPPIAETRWYRVERYSFGRVPDGEWRSIGFDLDGRSTTRDASKLSEGSCRRRSGSPTVVLEDGAFGVDNSFGRNVVPLLESLEIDLAGLLERSDRRLLLRLSGVLAYDSDDVQGALFVTAPSGDVYDVSFAEGAPRFVLDGRVRGATWEGVARSDAALALPFTIGTGTEALDLHAIHMRVELATGLAVLGAAMPADQFDQGPPPRPHWCSSGHPFDQLQSQLSTCADLVLGAPALQDEARICDAVSVGVELFLSAASPYGAVIATPPIAPLPWTCE